MNNVSETHMRSPAKSCRHTEGKPAGGIAVATAYSPPPRTMSSGRYDVFVFSQKSPSSSVFFRRLPRSMIFRCRHYFPLPRVGCRTIAAMVVRTEKYAPTFRLKAEDADRMPGQTLCDAEHATAFHQPRSRPISRRYTPNIFSPTRNVILSRRQRGIHQHAEKHITKPGTREIEEEIRRPCHGTTPYETPRAFQTALQAMPWFNYNV